MSRVDELLARVEDDPDDEHLREVLADALAQIGDPRGELAAVQRRLAQLEKSRVPLDYAQWLQVYGDNDSRIVFGKGVGFIERIDLDLDPPRGSPPGSLRDALEAFFARRAARLVEEVVMHGSTEEAGRATIEALAVLAQRAPLARSIEVRLPAGRRAVDIDLGEALAALAVRRLTLDVSVATTSSVLRRVWPGLARLDITATRKVEELDRLFEGAACPDLEELVPRLGTKELLRLIASPLLRRLRVLDLRGQYPDAATVERLAAMRTELPNLSVLGVPA